MKINYSDHVQPQRWEIDELACDHGQHKNNDRSR
jgi:hypothetical protein